MKKIIIFLLLLFLASPVFAKVDDESVLVHFRPEGEQDIYYQVTETQVHLVKGVQILGIKTIAGIEFLAFQKKTLAKLENSTGFVLLDSIKAILPAGQRVESTEDFKYLKP